MEEIDLIITKARKLKNCKKATFTMISLGISLIAIMVSWLLFKKDRKINIILSIIIGILVVLIILFYVFYCVNKKQAEQIQKQIDNQ